MLVIRIESCLSFYSKMILHSIISQMKEMIQRPKVLPEVSQNEHNVPRAEFCFHITV